MFNPPPAADAKRKTSAYAKLEQTNEDLGRELDAAKAYIAELEAAQPDQGSLFGLDLKNDKPDNIAEAIIGNVDLGRAEKIARAILKAIRAKSQKPAESDYHLPKSDFHGGHMPWRVRALLLSVRFQSKLRRMHRRFDLSGLCIIQRWRGSLRSIIGAPLRRRGPPWLRG